MKPSRLSVFLVTTGALLLADSLCAWAPLPVVQDPKLFMPGSQSGSIALPNSSQCTNCHAGYDPVSEPHHKWQGSMMAQATRDPLWLATMAVAAQDSIWALGNPNATDLCLRCHTPTGWLGGRSDPTNGAALTVNTGDFEGVNCAACHLMIDPFPALNLASSLPQETDPAMIAAANATRTIDIGVLSNLRLFDGSPFFSTSTNLPVQYGTATTEDLTRYIEVGAGQMFVDTNTKNRRGPRIDVSTKSHNFQYSRFHKSRTMCHTCHDVSNPVLANLTIAPDSSQSHSAASYFHVERTSSEFELSAYANLGGAPTGPPIAATGVTQAADCQDCHMPRVPGAFAKQGSTRTDAAGHELNGGNTWMSRILASADTNGPVPDAYNRTILDGTKYPGASIELTGLAGAGAALLEGEGRSGGMLQRAATLHTLNDPPGDASVRIVNHTGHKLISGFPEGRRMWLNVRFLDAQGATMSEINPYQPLLVSTDALENKVYVSGGDLTVTRDDLVYEANMSSSLTGESKTFHFVLATDRYKDNRIPPRGFRIADAPARIAHPRWHGEDAMDYFTPEEYAGGYDEVRFSKPANAAGWVATLFYQTTSKPYVEFLRDEIKGTAGSLLGVPVPSGELPVYRVQSDPFFTTLKGWGGAIWDLWLHNGGSAPVAMTTTISAPVITAMEMSAGTPVVSVQTLAQRIYQLERSTDLTPGSWAAVGGEVVGDGTLKPLTDPSPPAGHAFYRVRNRLP